MSNRSTLQRSCFETNYTSRLGIAPLPNKAVFARHSEKLSWIGRIPVYRAGWGTYLSTRDLCDRFMQARMPQAIVPTIAGLGFKGGYHFPVETDINSLTLQELQLDYVCALVEKVLLARGWDTIDALFVGSITLERQAALSAHHVLRRKGYHV